MCLVMFLGSDSPLKMIPFDNGHRAFHVSPPDGLGEAFRKQFTKKHLYLIGGIDWCSCSFLAGQAEKCWYEHKDLADGKREREQLARLVESLLATQSSVELYAVWISSDKVDDEPVLEKKRITIRELFDPHTYPADGSAAFSIEKRSLA